MRDLREFYDPSFSLPINGKTYTIPSPNAHDGVRLRMLFADPDAQFVDDDHVAEVAQLFGARWVDTETHQPVAHAAEGEWHGGVWSQMIDDGVDWKSLMHAGTTALMHFGIGAQLAEVFWETGLGDVPGKSLPPIPTGVSGARSSNPKRRKNAKKNHRKK